MYFIKNYYYLAIEYPIITQGIRNVVHCYFNGIEEADFSITHHTDSYIIQHIPFFNHNCFYIGSILSNGDVFVYRIHTCIREVFHLNYMVLINIF